MVIEFHCPFCGKTIRTSEENAGRHGKCPSCHQSVYVPTPPEKIEPLRLEPLDPAFEKQREREERATQEFQHRLLHERDLPPETAGTGRHAGGVPGRASASGARSAHAPGGAHPPPAPDVDVERLVIDYALRMAEGDLERAEALAGEIRRCHRQADDVIQRIMQDEILPAPLSKIPRPVLVGFFKQLR